MGDLWDQRQLVEAEADKLRAESELTRTNPEYIQAAMAAEQERAKASAEQDRMRAKTHAVRSAAITCRAYWKAFGVVVGRAAIIHLIWAVAFVAITWITVVMGWRGE